jgi:hypothetical protein
VIREALTMYFENWAAQKEQEKDGGAG